MLPFFALMLKSASAGGGGSSLPSIADENSTFNDEGTSTSGWTASNGSISVASSYLRLTKTSGGTSSSMSRSVTFPTANKDYILYGKARCSRGSNHQGVIWFLNGDFNVAIWFGTTAANTAYTDQRVSVIGTTSSGSVRNVAALDETLDYETTAVEFALHHDTKFGTLNAYLRESGRWVLKKRVACEYVSATTIQCLLSTPSPADSWIEFDHLTLCRPNLMSIGDSIDEGKTAHSPDPGLSLFAPTNRWQHHAVMYASLRNSIVISKGVGSQTSAQIESRLAADVTTHGPRVVFLHASTNDTIGGITLSARTTNVQNCVTTINGASASCVLLNAMYGTSTNSLNPGLRDYMLEWWNDYRPTLTGLALVIDIMQPLLSAGYMDAALTESDKIHPKAAGYQASGEYIASR